MKLCGITQLVGKHPNTPRYTGLPASGHIVYCFLCCYTLRGIENLHNLGESLCLSGSWVFHLSNEKVGIDYFRHSRIPGF